MSKYGARVAQELNFANRFWYNPSTKFQFALAGLPFGVTVADFLETVLITVMEYDL